ncbi:hypothetical protein [Rhizorhabdus phycosphaerae]|uniref:hypothetical protein n=1 Tax=Rhizorhabdus phycosphaerae TaxID=2711156 RepID=UPI0013EAF405|nr:hypothetical protein [Rhizorhabdus phycosphaerae]
MLRISTMAVVTFWLVGSIAVFAASHFAGPPKQERTEAGQVMMTDAAYGVARQLGR